MKVEETALPGELLLSPTLHAHLLVRPEVARLYIRSQRVNTNSGQDYACDYQGCPADFSVIVGNGAIVGDGSVVPIGEIQID